jgi:hypothetical protein
MHQPKNLIDVSVILPSSMDTPLFVHAKSQAGKVVKPIPPVYDSQLTVEAIVVCAKDPKPEVIVGGGGRAMVMAYRLLPNWLERCMTWTGFRYQLSRRPKEVEGEDNLYNPMPETYQVRGGYGTTGEHWVSFAKQHLWKVALATLIPVVAFRLLTRARAA